MVLATHNSEWTKGTDGGHGPILPPAEPLPEDYFDQPTPATQATTHRPRSHARTVEFMLSVVSRPWPVDAALDIGCGTGHSTSALLPYARSVIGVDPSSELLRQALRHPRIEYRKCFAEALPFPDRSFDLVSVGSAYRWLDHERFLSEAARVLRPRGWLVLYQAPLVSGIAEEPEFERWSRAVLTTRYPRVVRNQEPLTAAQAADYGLEEMACAIRDYERPTTLTDYVANLLTYSSGIRRLDGEREELAAVRSWMYSQLQQFFPGGEAVLRCEARIDVFRRLAVE